MPELERYFHYRNLDVSTVITSYSIHYTKLYEHAGIHASGRELVEERPRERHHAHPVRRRQLPRQHRQSLLV